MGKSHIINILFLGGAKRVSLAERFFDAAQSLNARVNIFSYELDKHVPISSIGEVIVGLRWEDKNIFSNLTDVIHVLDIHMVLPFVDPSISIAASIKKMIPRVFIPVSDVSLCDICYDKRRMSKWFISHGFLTPKETDRIPFIAKPRKGSASKGVIKVHSEEERTKCMVNVDREQYLFQELIYGDEYTVDCYVSPHGKILSVVPRRRIEVVGGEVVKTVTMRERDIIERTTAILESGSFVGPITLQYIREKSTGKIYVIEINPRFGGGVIASIEAGADIPLFLLKNYLNVPTAPMNHWKEDILMMRAYREFFIYANHY